MDTQSSRPLLVAERVGGSRARVFWAAMRARPQAAIALLLALLYLPWIAAIPLDSTLEGNRLEAAREMLHSGDWLVPTLGGIIYPAKPPLHPWTIALLSWPLGEVHLITGRMLSAIATIALCASVLAWGRRQLGTHAGVFAALALGIAPLVTSRATRAELESELTLFTTLALLAFWAAGRSDARASAIGFRVASGLALGAAVLVKGPPALLIFLCGAIAASVPRQRRRAMLRSAAVAVGIGLACALAWVVPLCARLGFSNATAVFNREVLERISRAGHTNAEPFWFYIPALLVALLPSVVFLPCVALVLPGRFSHSEVARSRAAFLWGWALLPVVLFSFSSGKETRYLLPTLPAWTLLLAWGWIRARASSRFQGWRRGLARTLDVATWILPLAWLAAGLWFFPDNTAVVVASAVCALVARAVFAWSLRSGKPAIALCMLVLAVATAKFAWAGTLLERQRAKIPVEEAGRAIAARLAPGEPWILIGRYRSWLDFAVNRPCLVVPDWAELAAVRAGQRGAQARFAFTLEQAIPATQVSLERVERWVVDGDAYCLVRLYGVR